MRELKNSAALIVIFALALFSFLGLMGAFGSLIPTEDPAPVVPETPEVTAPLPKKSAAAAPVATENQDAGIFELTWETEVSGTPEATRIEKYVNRFRDQNGLPPLSASTSLAILAQDRADEMARTGKFTHYSATDPSKGALTVFVEQNRTLGMASLSENIAVGADDYIDSKRAFEIWENSVTGHRENILDPSWTAFGTAVAVGTFEGNRSYFIVQIFAEPTTPAVQYIEGTLQRTTI